MTLNRKKRSFFQSDEFLDTLVKDGKLDKDKFKQLLEAILFSGSFEDKATLLVNGHAKIATDQQVIDKDNGDFSQTLFVTPSQVPDVTAENSSIVVTEVIWDTETGAIVPDTDNPDGKYRKRYLAKTNPSNTAQYDKFPTVIGTTVYTLDGTSGMPDLRNRTLQLCTYGTSVMEDDGAFPAITFDSPTGVLTFIFTMTDVGQVKLISTG